MAKIDAEGQTLVAQNSGTGTPQIHVEGSARIGSGDGRETVDFTWSAAEVLSETSGTRVHVSRGDLDSAAVEGITAAVKRMISRGRDGADPSDVMVLRLKFVEETTLTRVSAAVEPAADGYPSDGTDTEKARWLLEERPAKDNTEVAAIVGCSPSLVSSVDAGDR